MKECLSFGAGVQSSTLLYMSCLGILPKLDHVIFADTQWEPSAVYKHLEWCKGFAADHGITIEVRTAGNLRQDLLEFWGQRKSADGKRKASIPAFIKNPDGSKGIVRRQCTGTYKIDVIERYTRQEILGLKKGQRWPLEPVIRQWIGISEDEMHRSKVSIRPAVQYWHPLIEADVLIRMVPTRLYPVGYSRRDCIEWIKAQGLPIPPRSACIGCPFHKNDEWRSLTPAEFADACEVDRLIRVDRAKPKSGDLCGDPYLHPSLKPLSEVALGRTDDDPWQDMGNECSGICGV